MRQRATQQLPGVVLATANDFSDNPPCEPDPRAAAKEVSDNAPCEPVPGANPVPPAVGYVIDENLKKAVLNAGSFMDIGHVDRNKLYKAMARHFE